MNVYHSENHDTLDEAVWRRYWIAAGTTIECFGKRVRLRERDIAVNCWLMSLVQARQCERRTGKQPLTLLQHRHTLCEMTNHQPPPIAGLMVLLHRESDGPQELVQLAVWALGRCAGAIGISAVASLINDIRPAVRKEVARALRRMGGWAELRVMAAQDADIRVRRLALAAEPTPFADRLGRFVDDQVQRRATTEPPKTSRMRFWLNTRLERHPPKSISLIRRLLRRIRRLVHGT